MKFHLYDLDRHAAGWVAPGLAVPFRRMLGATYIGNLCLPLNN